jgi:site-specific recombinase XerD
LTTIKNYRLYLARLTDEKGKGLSRVTQSYHVIALRSFFKWLTKNDIEVLAAEKIELPRAESKSLKFLTRAQLNRLIASVDTSREVGLRDRAILEVLFSTGLRVSELVRLDRDKIDFESKEFGVIGKGGPRVVFLSERSATWLSKYFNEREDRWKPAFIRYAKSKLPEKPGGEDLRLSVRGVQRIVEKYRKRARLPVKITPHGLRHTFATDLLSSGAGLREVQEMLGHKNVATTQIYTHVTNPQLKKVHERFHSGNK